MWAHKSQSRSWGHSAGSVLASDPAIYPPQVPRRASLLPGRARTWPGPRRRSGNVRPHSTAPAAGAATPRGGVELHQERGEQYAASIEVFTTVREKGGAVRSFPVARTVARSNWHGMSETAVVQWKRSTTAVYGGSGMLGTGSCTTTSEGPRALRPQCGTSQVINLKKGCLGFKTSLLKFFSDMLVSYVSSLRACQIRRCFTSD